MTLNPLYRVLIRRINDFLGKFGITRQLIEFTNNHIKVIYCEYKIRKLPLKNICVNITEPHEIYYHLFKTVWKNIFSVNKIPGRHALSIKSNYFKNYLREYCYHQLRLINKVKIEYLLGIDNLYNVNETLTIMHSEIIEYCVLINYISSKYLINDLRYVLCDIMTELFLNY